MNGPPPTTIRVLLLEDSPSDARAVHDALRGSPSTRYEIVHCDRMERLLATLAGGATFDVALLDLCVPDSEGLPTVERVRAAAPRLPIVVHSGLGEEELAVEAVRAGAQDYVVKDDLDARLIPRALRYAIERHRTERALRESEERYALAVQGANDGLWDWNLETNLVYFSPRWCEMLGLDGGEVPRRPESWFDRVHPEHSGPLLVALKRHLDGLAPHLELEYPVRHADGSWRWVLCRGLAVRDTSGNATRIAGSHTDITRRHEMELRLAHEAFHDSLTGLPNRELFLDRLNQAMRRARRGRHGFAVLFLDLDRFKLVNDSLGHHVGDLLLVEVGRRVRGCLRPSDTVARLGGDEFVVLLEDVGTCDQAEQAADRIQSALRRPVDVEGREIFTSASIGVVCEVSAYATPDDLLRDADSAMYRAKSGGRGRHEVYDRGLHARAVARLELEADLRHAIERRELAVHYQPIVSLANGHTVRCEALLRWQHPQRGLVGPSEFVPILEETGMIVPVGLWVFEEVCHQIQEWRLQSAFDGRPIMVSINVSSRQFADAGFVDDLTAILRRMDLPSYCVALEITESVLMHDPTAAGEMLSRLHDLGFRIHLDDFGTGYSSLSYLQRFPVDGLKIDRSFVSGMGARSSDREIIRAIISLGRSLGVSVVAEGIETAEQLDSLLELDCEYGQGFLFARPMPGQVPVAPMHLVPGRPLGRVPAQA